MEEQNTPLPTKPILYPAVPHPALDEQYTYEDVANLKRVKVQTVQEWVKRGMIPSPVYTGSTARFTSAHVVEIMCGTSQPGTFEVTLSPRAVTAAKAVAKKRAAAKAAAKKKPAKAAAKKKPAKKGGVK